MFYRSQTPIFTLERRTPSRVEPVSPAPTRRKFDKRPLELVPLLSPSPLCLQNSVSPCCPSSNDPAGALVHRDTVEDNPVAVRATVRPHLFSGVSIDLGNDGRSRELSFDARGPLAAGRKHVAPLVQVDAMKDGSG